MNMSVHFKEHENINRTSSYHQTSLVRVLLTDSPLYSNYMTPLRALTITTYMSSPESIFRTDGVVVYCTLRSAIVSVRDRIIWVGGSGWSGLVEEG